MFKYKTNFESTHRLQMPVTLGHGENADFYTSISDCGVAVALTDYTVRAIYQPESDWDTDNYYECPAEIDADDNVAIIHWGNTYDNGEDRVKIWVHFLRNGKVAYPAFYMLKLYSTPGFTPNAITPIPETLNFAEYTLENAPWLLSSEISAYATISYADTQDLSVLTDAKEYADNLQPEILSSLTSESTNEQLAGAKCVYDSLSANLQTAKTYAETCASNAQNVFIARYDITSHSDIIAAWQADKAIFICYQNVCYPLTNVGNGVTSDLVFEGIYLNEGYASSKKFCVTVEDVWTMDSVNVIVDYSAIANKPDVLSSITSTSTNDQLVGAKCVYDLVGDIETLINNI